ncbi:MAG: BrnT family toxin [Thermodesulfovibrionia bacterium]|nr:BrnT family toxin [Thermodesulfovibrionia bacterium]
MKISQILWDEESVYHIAKHGISPREVEEAIFEGSPLVLKGRDGKYIVLSRSLSGRYLIIIAAFKLKGRVKVITARDMDEKERKYYQRRGK